MKKSILYILFLISLVYSDAAKLTDPYENIKYFTLENGLQVYLLSDARSTNTQISLKVNVGWDIETDETFGLSHLVEHIVFRDQRIPYRDYLDYFKKEGASYVNGYTSRYSTEFVTTIENSKSYWIAEQFSQMIFDKNVTNEDLEIERGALQVEIGEEAWNDGLYRALSSLRKIAPPNEDMYSNHFGVKKVKELPDIVLEKRNNKLFSFHQVMKHYADYYYPQNMILKIAGNFDNTKMETLIRQHYGKVKKNGMKRTTKPPRDAKLNHKPYCEYIEGGDENVGYIGAKYIFDDCQKQIILSAFMDFVATKIQQTLRNKEGKSYGVDASLFQSRGAGVASITFDGLRENFEKNIDLVKLELKKYVSQLNNNMVTEALTEYEKHYKSVEFDSKSLMSLIDKVEHMRTDHNITDKTHFNFFETIRPDVFKKVVRETFVPENYYSYISRDYYYFENDHMVIQLLFLALFTWIYFTYNTLILGYRKASYSKRDVIFSRRLSNRFIGFIIFIFIYLISQLFYAWMEYLVLKYIFKDPQYLFTLDVPYSYISEIITMSLSLIFFFIVYRYVAAYVSALVVTPERLYFLGSNPNYIEKKSVENMGVSPWSPLKFFQIKGWAFMFWRPLLKVQTQDDTFYLRSNNAKELHEDLNQKWLKQ